MSWSDPLLKFIKDQELKDLARAKKEAKRNKYGAVRTRHAGMSFDSASEAETYDHLLWLQRAKMISNIRRQVSIQLTPSVAFKIDFVVYDELLKEDVGVEFKGHETERWKVIKQLWNDFGPMRMRIFGKLRGRVFVVKELPAAHVNTG